MIAKWSICLFLVKPSIFYCGVSNDMPTNSDDPWAIRRKAVQEQRWRLAVAVTSDPSSLKKATGCSKRSLCSSAVSNKRCRVLAAQRGPDKGWSRNDPKYQVTLRPQAQCQEVSVHIRCVHSYQLDGRRRAVSLRNSWRECRIEGDRYYTILQLNIPLTCLRYKTIRCWWKTHPSW